MKIALFIGFTLIVIPHWVSTTEETITNLIVTTPKQEILMDTVIRRVKNYWIENQDDGNTVVGRCIGLAKKIRSILPIAVFLMGVIMTLLAFLTLFSLKTLGMVGLLLLINTSGIVAKVTAAFASHKEEKHPQTVHFHVHKDSDPHGYHIGHSGPGPEWDRTSKYSQDIKHSQDFDLDRIESYNLYNKLLKSLST